MPGGGLGTGQTKLGSLAPLSPPQLSAGSVGVLFPSIRPLPLPGAGKPVGSLFPTIRPSPSPAPGAGGPQNSLSPGTRPSVRSAAAGHTAARTAAADDSVLAGLPLGEGQAVALFFLAGAAALIAGVARSRTRRRG
jgi:hypothetical protein